MKGSMSLTTVLLIGVMIVAGSTVLVLTTVDMAISTKRFESGQKAKDEARTCLEEAMYKIRRDTSFEGEVTYSSTEFTCTATVGTIPGEQKSKSISIVGTLGEYSSTQAYIVEIFTEPYVIKPL